MKTYTFLAILVLFFFLLLTDLGCAGSCLKLGGNYKDYSGNIEYCFSQEKSEENELPTLEGEGKDSVLIESDVLDSILSKLEDVSLKNRQTFKARIEKALQSRN